MSAFIVISAMISIRITTSPMAVDALKICALDSLPLAIPKSIDGQGEGIIPIKLVMTPLFPSLIII